MQTRDCWVGEEGSDAADGDGVARRADGRLDARIEQSLQGLNALLHDVDIVDECLSIMSIVSDQSIRR